MSWRKRKDISYRDDSQICYGQLRDSTPRSMSVFGDDGRYTGLGHSPGVERSRCDAFYELS